MIIKLYISISQSKITPSLILTINIYNKKNTINNY